jgi:hypothetical protein
MTIALIAGSAVFRPSGATRAEAHRFLLRGAVPGSADLPWARFVILPAGWSS